jgi:hypothetical protein
VIAVVAIATLVVLGVAFFLGKVPDVPAMIREPIAVSMLQNGANRASFEHFLKISGADWHNGYGYQRGESYGGFDMVPHNRCTIECESVIQAAFTKTFGICYISGDVVSARFDKKGKLQAWNLDQAEDGC